MELSARLSTAMGKQKNNKQNFFRFGRQQPVRLFFVVFVLFCFFWCFTVSQAVRLYQGDWKTTKQNKKRGGIFRRRKQIGSLLEPDDPRDAEMLENRNTGATNINLCYCKGNAWRSGDLSVVQMEKNDLALATRRGVMLPKIAPCM